MGLRPARIYRKFKRPYTRVATVVPRRCYIKGVPGSKLHIFEVGNPHLVGDFTLALVPKIECQVRHNALEAARVAAGGYMKKFVEEKDFFLKMRVYPHQVLREHAQAAVAQADRFYDGMAHPFGKPAGTAARVKVNHPILTISAKKENLNVVKEALKRAGAKIPVSCRVVE